MTVFPSYQDMSLKRPGRPGDQQMFAWMSLENFQNHLVSIITEKIYDLIRFYILCNYRY